MRVLLGQMANVVIPAVAGQTLLLTSSVLLHALVTLSTHVGIEDGKTLAKCVVLVQRRLLVGDGWCQQHPPQAAVILTCPEPQAGKRATRLPICSPIVDRGVVSCQTLSHELLSWLASSKGFRWGIGTVLALRRGLAAEWLL